MSVAGVAPFPSRGRGASAQRLAVWLAGLLAAVGRRRNADGAVAVTPAADPIADAVWHTEWPKAPLP